MTDERELSLAVVGIDHPNEDKSRSNRRFEARLCKAGDPVELRREPKNKHDENAVAVFSERGVQLGYLTAERAPWIGGKLAAGEEVVAVFQGESAAATIIRVRFGGGAPTPPMPRPLPAYKDPDEVIDATGRDFYPDPEGPDWGA